MAGAVDRAPALWFLSLTENVLFANLPVSVKGAASMEVVDGGKGKEREPGVIPLHDGLPTDPEYLKFVIQLALSNGNVAAASRAIGWGPAKGRHLVKRHPELKEIAKTALSIEQREVVKSWREMHAKALRTIDEAMDDNDGRVRLAAADKVIERTEGKVQPSGMDLGKEPEDVEQNITMRFAAALHISKGMTMAQSLLYAEKNPDEVQEWAERHGHISAA